MCKFRHITCIHQEHHFWKLNKKWKSSIFMCLMCAGDVPGVCTYYRLLSSEVWTEAVPTPCRTSLCDKNSVFSLNLIFNERWWFFIKTSNFRNRYRTSCGVMRVNFWATKLTDRALFFILKVLYMCTNSPKYYVFYLRVARSCVPIIIMLPDVCA